MVLMLIVFDDICLYCNRSLYDFDWFLFAEVKSSRVEVSAVRIQAAMQKTRFLNALGTTPELTASRVRLARLGLSVHSLSEASDEVMKM